MLRRWLGRPTPYLCAMALVVLAVAWDSGRRPRDQVTARIYISGVKGYQAVAGPIVGRAVQCRFRPTCSEYSIEAVRRFGIRRGLILTTRRVMACRPPVTPGTSDPVPPA